VPAFNLKYRRMLQVASNYNKSVGELCRKVKNMSKPDLKQVVPIEEITIRNTCQALIST